MKFTPAIPDRNQLRARGPDRAAARPHRSSGAARPAQALMQLNQVINRVQGDLARGISLPAGAQAKVYKTNGDPTADPVSALLIYRGLRTATGGRIDVQMLPSDLHVFTRLRARNPAAVTAADQQRQRTAFEELVARVSQ
jgi:carboxylesterase